MHRRVTQFLDAPTSVAAASAITLLIGLFFTFVWAPHPWGWRGIDQYHNLALALSRGEPFGTTDVPWGYAYYVAAWYAAFGEHTWLPVLGQVVLNAAVPVLLFHLLRPGVGPRLATLAALLIGVFSFNTIYASTQASDAICTVLFLASLVAFSRGARSSATGWFAAAGLLAGLAPQFRPNMVLLPLGLAGIYVMLTPRRPKALLHATVFLALVITALVPWTIRNYRLTGAILPTSTHGAVQLWYGSLQVAPYLENHARNPRSVFERTSFEYTSLAHTPIVIQTEQRACGDWRAASVDLVYWTDRHPVPSRVAPDEANGPSLVFEVPGQPSPTVIYYHFDARWPAAGDAGAVRQSTPPNGAQQPFMYLVSDDHLGDLDRHGDYLDIFDIVRLMRRLAWEEGLPHEDLDFDGDGAIGRGDLETALARLLSVDEGSPKEPTFQALESTASTASLFLSDGSSLTLHRDGFAKVTDLEVLGEGTGSLVSAHRRMPPTAAAAADNVVDPCRGLVDTRVNEVFYRSELHRMRRYTALAFDNIWRDPLGFAAASAYRVGRMFIIRGSVDPAATYQFSSGHFVYAGGLLFSSAYLATFLVGAIVAWRRYPHLRILLLPIAYIPLTLAFVLTNMRYTVTVQPLMFAFIAVALAAAFRLDEPESTRSERFPLI